MMYKVKAIHQKPDYKYEKTLSKPFIMKEEADKEHERLSFIARELLAKNEIIDYRIITIETCQ